MAVDCGRGGVKRVGGVLSKAAKGFGSGSMWDLVPESNGKVWGKYDALLPLACTPPCKHVYYMVNLFYIMLVIVEATTGSNSRCLATPPAFLCTAAL